MLHLNFYGSFVILGIATLLIVMDVYNLLGIFLDFELPNFVATIMFFSSFSPHFEKIIYDHSGECLVAPLNYSIPHMCHTFNDSVYLTKSN